MTWVALVFVLAACSGADRAEVVRTDCTPVPTLPHAVATPSIDLLHWTQSVQAALPMRSSTVAAMETGPLPFVETRRFCSTSPDGEAHCTIYECSSTGEAISCLEYYVSAREVDGDAAGVLEDGYSASSEAPVVTPPESESSAPIAAPNTRGEPRRQAATALIPVERGALHVR